MAVADIAHRIARRSVLDDVVVPAVLVGQQGWEATQSALRSPKARSVAVLPLVAVALKIGVTARANAEGDAAVKPHHPWPYASLIQRGARHNGLAPALVAAVVAQESGFDPDAYNKASGAAGLMQLTPVTRRALGVSDATDAQQSVFAGCGYLASLMRRFDGRVRLALAAYNAGPTLVERIGRVPAYPETRRYVREVMRRYARYGAAGE
jgi:soluble lytic murein transglycosylase-like protein